MTVVVVSPRYHVTAGILTNAPWSRSIWWCPFLNEPVVLLFHKDKPRCSGCNVIFDNVEQMNGDHDYIGTVHKIIGAGG